MPGFFELPGELARELGGALPRGVFGDPEQVHSAGVDLDHERHVQPLERDRAIDVKEVR